MLASATQGGHNYFKTNQLLQVNYYCITRAEQQSLWTESQLPVAQMQVVHIMCISNNATRWLYCVECPQYSTRLEALTSDRLSEQQTDRQTTLLGAMRRNNV